jgi:hypothetical protein
MSCVKQKALSGPPSQKPFEGGSNSAPPFISDTVAALSLLWYRFFCNVKHTVKLPL